MNRLVENNSVAKFGAALIILVAISWISYINLLSFKKANDWVEHSQKVKVHLNKLILHLTEAESDQRGYLLTGNSRYLERYKNAVEVIPPEIQSLQTSTSDNSTQQQRLDGLKPLVSTKLAELQNTINLRRNQSLAAALRIVQTDRGKQLMDEIKQRVREMETAEDQLLQQRTAESQTLAQTTALVIIVGSILTAIVVALAIFTLDRDIKKRLKVEEQLQTLNQELEQRVKDRTAQLEAASTAKDEFLSILSHELRTPLNAMLGWARLLRAGNLSAQKSAQALEVIERNAKTQAQLIEDILDISRIIQGKLRLHVRPVQPSEIIEAAIDAVRPAAEAKSIRLQPVLDASAGPISGDSDRLQQVVWNLLANAIKFTPKGGRVQIRLERINSHIEITVSDTGIGISADFLVHVFDRFRQADSTVTRAHGGLGLGLAIVRQLVELHGGTVKAISPGEGQGSTFTVILPLMILHTDVTDSDRVHPRAGGEVPFNKTAILQGLQVLVVDDEADARALLATTLEQCGAIVTAAASVSEAIALLKKSQPNVLVSDIGMPESDGYALIRQVRALSVEPGEQIPAIALTAYARVEDRIRALSAGFQMHIPKPIEPAELVAAIANLTGRAGNV